MSPVVIENPVINSPFEEPRRHFRFSEEGITDEIASQMLANCGIQVKLQYGNYEQVLGKWPNGIIPGRKFDLGLFAWTTTSIPACEYYQTWNIPSDENPEGLNYPGYSGATYDTACYDARSSISAADMSNYHKQAARLFSQELPVLPLYSYLNVSAVAPHIMAFTLNSTEYRFWLIEEIHLGETENIPTTGGSLTSPDDTTNYMFPEGSFSEDTDVTHIPLSPVKLPPITREEGIGHYFENISKGTIEKNTIESYKANQPYNITISYTNAELGNMIEATLALYYWDGEQWVKETTSLVDVNTNTITAAPDHFGQWAVLGEAYKLNYLPIINK